MILVLERYRLQVLASRDFNAPLVPPRPADSSAATIASTALLLLSRIEKTLSPPNITGSLVWQNLAIEVK